MSCSLLLRESHILPATPRYSPLLSSALGPLVTAVCATLFTIILRCLPAHLNNIYVCMESFCKSKHVKRMASMRNRLFLFFSFLLSADAEINGRNAGSACDV